MWCFTGAPDERARGRGMEMGIGRGGGWAWCIAESERRSRRQQGGVLVVSWLSLSSIQHKANPPQSQQRQPTETQNVRRLNETFYVGSCGFRSVSLI